MSHELEIIDGVPQVMLRENAWHRLGTVVGDSFSWLDAIAANMAVTFPVAKVPLAELIDNPKLTVPVETYVALRSDGAILHAGHGSSWAPYPVEQAYEFVTYLRDECGIAANLDSLGTIRDGRQWFMSFNSGKFDIGGYEITNHLTASGSFDGTWPFQLQSHEIVAVCANTITAVRHAGSMVYRFKNTSGLANKVEEAKRVVNLERARTAGFKELGEKLLATPVSERKYTAVMDALFPVSEDEQSTKAQNANEAARDAVRALYTAQADLDVVQGVEKTAWGLLQAVNTWENWGAPVRRTKGVSTDTARALRQIDASVTGKQPVTDKALDLLLV